MHPAYYEIEAARGRMGLARGGLGSLWPEVWLTSLTGFRALALLPKRLMFQAGQPPQVIALDAGLQLPTLELAPPPPVHAKERLLPPR